MRLGAAGFWHSYRHEVHGLIFLVASLAFAGYSSARTFDEVGHQDEKVFNVRKFGAVGDGKTLDTLAITKAIRAANEAGSGRVVFSPGIYLSGTFELLSNVTLDLERLWRIHAHRQSSAGDALIRLHA